MTLREPTKNVYTYTHLSMRVWKTSVVICLIRWFDRFILRVIWSHALKSHLFSTIINIMPQMLFTEFNFYWTQNISLIVLLVHPLYQCVYALTDLYCVLKMVWNYLIKHNRFDTVAQHFRKLSSNHRLATTLKKNCYFIIQSNTIYDAHTV